MVFLRPIETFLNTHVKKLLLFLSDDSRRKCLGEKGKEYAKDKWSANVLAKKVVKFYKSAITRKSSLVRYLDTRTGNIKGAI